MWDSLVLLLADVARVERHVVVALDNVEDGHGVTAGQKGFDNVPSEKAAAADDQVDVSLASGHGGMWREERRRPVCVVGRRGPCVEEGVLRGGQLKKYALSDHCPFPCSSSPHLDMS